jgi:hypothetical protein
MAAGGCRYWRDHVTDSVATMAAHPLRNGMQMERGETTLPPSFGGGSFATVSCCQCCADEHEGHPLHMDPADGNMYCTAEFILSVKFFLEK